MHRRCDYGTMRVPECMKCAAEEQSGRAGMVAGTEGPVVHARTVFPSFCRQYSIKEVFRQMSFYIETGWPIGITNVVV